MGRARVPGSVAMNDANFSPARSPTIYSSPVDSPTWEADDDGRTDDVEGDLARSLSDKLLILQEEEDRRRERSDLERDVVLIRKDGRQRRGIPWPIPPLTVCSVAGGRRRATAAGRIAKKC